MILTGTIQIRHDTSANWTANNPVLLAGEEGTETNTNQRKIGDGTTAWNSLPYLFVANVTNTGGIVAFGGGGQGSATALTATNNFISTVVSTGDSVKALPATVNAFQTIHNNGANDLNIFPTVGDAFIGEAVNAALVIPAGGMLSIACCVLGTYQYY